MMNQAIILTDGKAGHENQSKALARSLGLNYQLLPIQFKSKFHKSLSYLLDHLGLRTLWVFKFEKTDIKPGTIFIGAGSGTFYGTKAFAQKYLGKCAVILYPRGYHLPSFDVILAPAFDNPLPAKNVITIPANLVANDEAFYAEGVKKFWEVRGLSDLRGQEYPLSFVRLPALVPVLRCAFTIHN